MKKKYIKFISWSGLQFITFLYESLKNIDEPYYFDIQGYISDATLIKEITDCGIKKSERVINVNQGDTDFDIFVSHGSLTEKKILKILEEGEKCGL